ncbi:MAG TPA: hypothetical protein VH416_02895 [Gaiellaceae bacterium]
MTEHAGGDSLTVSVGEDGRERFGSCAARLGAARLADGYLPILETRYLDAGGTRYRQESFAARIPRLDSLVSFVRITADARGSAGATVRFSPSADGLALGGRDAKLDGAAFRYRVPAGGRRTVYAAWLNRPSDASLKVGAHSYAAARRSVVAYWRSRLAQGASILVPERRVVDAERAALLQNLALTWRYSIGNAHEEFSFPESVDVAQVAGEAGYPAVERAILRTSLGRPATPYPSWELGEKLVATAAYYFLYRDAAYVDAKTPSLSRYVAALGRGVGADGNGLLPRERYSSDIPDEVYGLHAQAVAWQGLREMSVVWAATDHPVLAARSRNLSTRLGAGLRHAIASSQQRLADGSLFVPVRLLDDEKAYGTLTESRSGSYWNLVMPYALASGLFAPGSREANGVLEYMLRHGSRLLGLVRAGAYSLYGDTAYPVGGTDEVYGLNASRFLADQDRPDQLVLSLYGELAAAMTPGTFVAGEAAGVYPVTGERRRAMFLPPSNASNAAFLETLRLTLVHETLGRDGAPTGLQLAYATPRAWLARGKRISVRNLPTSFGRLSYSIASVRGGIRVSLDVPQRPSLGPLSLRLRLPAGAPLTSVLLDGRAYRRFDPVAETVDLSGLDGHIELFVRHR